MNLRNLILLLALFLSPFANAIPSYTINSDGTVSDATTGLTWMRCSMGQTWTGSTCSGSASEYIWSDAVALTTNFASYHDWRLPNVRELLTIVDRTVINPAINTTVFPNTPASRFQSSSEYADVNADFGAPSAELNAWLVNFEAGFASFGEYNQGYGDKYHGFQVRLVRDGRSFSLLGLSQLSTDYTDNGDGTVAHTPTGLIWKRCSEGQIWTGSTCSGSATTYTWDGAMALTSNFAGNSDWRVPTEEELISLIDFTIPAPGPTINTILFPNTYAGMFLVDFGLRQHA